MQSIYLTDSDTLVIGKMYQLCLGSERLASIEVALATTGIHAI
jgi:hypothetical protein